MRFLSQAREVFEGSQPAGETQNHVDGHKPSELQPSKRSAIHTEPQCLADDHICLRRFIAGKAAMEKIDYGQYGTGQRHQHKEEKRPARPNIRERSVDEKIKSAPAKDHQQERGEPEWFESQSFIHCGNYTLGGEVHRYIEKKQRDWEI